METAIKVSAAGIAAVLAASLLKKRDPELALALCLAACAVILTFAAGLGERAASFLRRAREISGLSPTALSAVIKCVGIGLISRLGADVCKDAGSLSVASAVELTGALAAVVTALPLFETLLRMIGELI